MKNYLIAFLLFAVSLFWINCNRPAQNFSRQQVDLPPVLVEEQASLLQDTFYVGDTIELVYHSKGISLYDTLIQSVEPAKNLKFLSYQELGPPEEMMFARMDISEIEQKRRHVFKYIAKKKGMVTVSLQESVKDEQVSVELPKPKSWQLNILKR